MAKIVETSYRENYGAHSWDGTGECPQHWKNKGGSTYVFLNASNDDIESIIGHSSDYSEETIMGIGEVENIDDVWEEWEERTYWTKAEDGTWLRERFSPKDDYSMRRGLKSYKHTWVYGTTINHDTAKYSVRYEFKNGMVANSEEEATEIFEHLNKRAMA